MELSSLPAGEAVRLWLLRSDQQRHSQEKVSCGDAILDGPRGDLQDPLRTRGILNPAAKGCGLTEMNVLIVCSPGRWVNYV